MQLWGGIEAGGTKWICAVGTGPDDLRAELQFPTTTPDETLGHALAFFQPYRASLAALGVGSFGPVDLDPTSTTFGYITTTPKPGWAWIDVAGELGRSLQLPVRFETDVNAAALGERQWGAARDLDTFVYLTVGTGIGGGGMVNGALLHGLLHPEMGHMRVPHDRVADPYPGACPYHGDCLEGLASGPALVGRWGQRGETLPPQHPAWALEARYLALGLVNIICALSPQRVIVGGGVPRQPRLLPLVRHAVRELLNGYLQVDAIAEQLDRYIVAPELGDRAGVLGALALAQQ